MKIAILTNASAADQRSMIGYGELLMETARRTGADVVEWRGASLLSRLPLPYKLRKLALNLDRFVISPLKLFGRRADLVHVVDPGNCIYLPLTRHRKSLVTVHDMIPYLARDGKLQGWRPTAPGRWLLNQITKSLARTDHIICVSHTTKLDLLSYMEIPEHRISVIHNAVFQPMKPASLEVCAELRNRLGIPPDATLILHVGRSFYKNREAVIEVLAQVRLSRPDVHVIMVGALTRELEEQASRLGLKDFLHVLHAVGVQDMAALYTTAAVLLFPSLYEGFGLPVIEAQMCGTPVVCSDAGALPEVAHSSSVVPACDGIHGLTSAVLEALNEPRVTQSRTGDSLLWKQRHQELYRTFRSF